MEDEFDLTFETCKAIILAYPSLEDKYVQMFASEKFYIPLAEEIEDSINYSLKNIIARSKGEKDRSKIDRITWQYDGQDVIPWKIFKGIKHVTNSEKDKSYYLEYGFLFSDSLFEFIDHIGKFRPRRGVLPKFKKTFDLSWEENEKEFWNEIHKGMRKYVRLYD